MLDELRIKSIDDEALEELFKKRLVMVEEALARKDFELLQAISAIDKENLRILSEEKRVIKLKMNQLDKVNQYVALSHDE